MANRMRTYIAVLMTAPLLGFAQPGAAQTAPGHDPAGGLPPGLPALVDLPGVLSWNTLAQVKQVKSKDRILPKFTKEIAALDKKEVKIQGFMMPLEPGDRQKHFLISVTPPSCSFCLPAGPEGVVEVKSKTPIKYTFEPVVVSGRMSILKDDPMGLYYRLTDAAPASGK